MRPRPERPLRGAQDEQEPKDEHQPVLPTTTELASLLSSQMSAKQFMRQYWDTKPLHVARDAPASPPAFGLLCVEDIDALLAYALLPGSVAEVLTPHRH